MFRHSISQVAPALCMAAAVAAPAAAGPADPKAWVDYPYQADTWPIVRRVTDASPLSDQRNKGHWKRYAPMTDEFGGTALDASK